MGGLFGCVSQSDCVREVFYGTDYHSHLGTRRAGMAVMNHEDCHRSIHNIENDYFRTKFEPDLDRFSGNKGIGVISDTDPQPLVIGSHLGVFAVATVGRINNIDQLAEKAYDSRQFFTETKGFAPNPTEVVAMLISREQSFEDGIRAVQESIEGSCSFLILTREGLWAARDKLGRTPLTVGTREGAFCVASETCAMPNLGYVADRHLGPGEAVFITPDSVETRIAERDEMQVCSFLWVYYGYPASTYEGINVEQVRYRCGSALARNDHVVPDIVSGIPDSGIGHALGYANERKIPYMRAFVKYTPTWPRSFMPQNQKVRDLVARMKLIPVHDLIRDRKVMFCEDSIVRGTQLRDTIQEVFRAGAREVHMRPACPCLLYPCDFLNFSTSQSSMALLGRQAVMALEGSLDNIDQYAVPGSEKQKACSEWIADHLGLTSCIYQRLDDLVEAVGLPRERLCTHCWDNSSHF
ncbi:MAG: amidophosphoribosyltransferase [Desulfatibacillaceae bacterium]